MNRSGAADIRHGTNHGYKIGRCRCDACRRYQCTRVAANRAARLATGKLNHGTRSAWDAGCRCGACLARKRQADRDYARQKRRTSGPEVAA